MTDIVLATLNARWIHTAFGLRCLRANLGTLRERSVLVERDVQVRPVDFVEAILANRPRIVGLSVYVWNAAAMASVVATLKRVAPEVVVVLGGPEVSHETALQPITALADHVVRGEGDRAFRDLCESILTGSTPSGHVIDAAPPELAMLALPYDEYTDADVAHRIVYLEASRGCPFLCEFCLSSLDERVRAFPLESFLAAMDRLLARGVRHFKFVDRTFNLGLATSLRILEFFRERLAAGRCDGLFLHFELIPDRLPGPLRAAVAAFPPGALQFEVGIQTFDPAVADRISRRQDVARITENLRFLREHTGVHVHADLIVGLPGEDLPTFARGFDALVALGPHEIQVGILKRLRGAPIVRHDAEFGMRWSPDPPYEILATDALDFVTLQRLRRFARCVDLVMNSGSFKETLPLLWRDASPFARLLAFSDWLFARTAAVHGIALHRLTGFLLEFLVDVAGVPRDEAGSALFRDYQRTRPDDWPVFLRPFATSDAIARPRAPRAGAKRQARHGEP